MNLKLRSLKRPRPCKLYWTGIDRETTKYILGSMSTTKASDTTVMSVKVKKDLKAKAQAVAGQYGIPLGTLLNAYMHQLVLTGQVYFPAVEVATPQMEKIIAEIEAERRDGKTIGPFETVEEFIADLEK